jgi:flagellar motor switch protein FliM
MERVLTQDEIDAMVRQALGRQDGSKPETRSIKPCTFRQSGQLTGEQVAAVNGMHEGFARSLTQSLGAYLRVSFEVNLVSVEQLSYSEFLERIPEVTYMMCFEVEQMSAEAAMQIDHSLVFPLVDILLGGNGACEILSREISEIEEHIMEGVARIICRELETAWTPLGIKLALEKRQSPAQMQNLLSPTEKTLCLSFEVKVAEATGTLNLVFPVSVSNSLIRKLSVDRGYGRHRTHDRAGGRLTAKMMDCIFPIQLALPTIKLPIQTVVGLAPQGLYDLGIPVRKSPSLVIAGREAFEANPVRHGRQRAAQVARQVTISTAGRKR